MAKNFWILGLTVLGVGLIAASVDAQVRPSPQPILQAAPSFDCSATVNANTGLVTVKRTNATPIAKDAAIVAVIKTPNGTADAVFCGSAFQALNSSSTSSFPKPATKDTSWIYTCTAKVGQGTCPNLH